MGRCSSAGGYPARQTLAHIGSAIDATYMSDASARGFTGTMIGMACVDSYRRDIVAHFGYFDLQYGLLVTS